MANRYRIVRFLGAGAMKLVYLAEDSNLSNRRCAVAEMAGNLVDPAEKQAVATAFDREAEMLASLVHDRIVRIYDRLSEDGRHYLMMEYVEGETLERRLEAAPDKQLDEGPVAGIALQILAALEYLHGRNPPVIYRDLKPANVMIAPNGGVKLIDFGIARLFAPKKTGTMIGTQGYAAPEQYEGKAEPRSDLYALGVTMLQLLTGWDPALHPPFMFPAIRTIRANIDPVLETLIGEALVLDLKQRIGSAAEFSRRLQNVESPPGSPGNASAKTAAALPSPQSALNKQALASAPDVSAIDLPAFKYGPHDRYAITFACTTGYVVSVSKAQETNRTNSGNHKESVLEFFLKDLKGKEAAFTLRNWDIPLREGHRLTIVTPAEVAGFLARLLAVRPGELLLLVNHDLGQWWAGQFHSSHSDGCGVGCFIVFLIVFVFVGLTVQSIGWRLSSAVVSLLCCFGIYATFSERRDRRNALKRLKSHVEGLARKCLRVLA